LFFSKHFYLAVNFIAKGTPEYCPSSSDFVNEEINLKKALATGALAAGMAFSNPATSQTTNIQKPDTTLSQRVSNPLVIKKTTLGELKSDSIKGYYLDGNNIWKDIVEKSYHSDFENIGSIKSESLDGYDKILLTNKYYQYSYYQKS
jgi:hypothetical protein